MPTRLFAAEADGKLVAHTALYSEDGVGAGTDLTFLVADADDWPHRLYEKLGFETVGRYARFFKRRP